MPLIAILAIVFSIGAGSGGLVAYKLQEAKVLAIELKIQQANDQSLAILMAAKQKVNEASIEALNLNKELDDANAIHVQTINHYYDALHTELAKRVRSDNKTGCPDTLSSSLNTGKSKDSATKTRFSEEFSGFLEGQLKLADEAANYAWTAYEFVNKNCGIK